MINALSRAFRLAESGLLVLILTAMISLAAYQVVARNFFDSGIMWGDGAVRVLVLWVTLVGAMVASRNDEHIRMDLVARFLDERWQGRLRRLTSAFTCVVCGVFAWFSFEFVRLEYEAGIVAFAGVPAWLCESIMPIGAAIICLRYLLHVFKPP